MSDENTNKFSLIDLPDSLDEAVKNLTDQPTKNAGQTLGDIWYLVFGGLSHMADKRRIKYAQDLENYRKELEQSISAIPKEKKIEPSIQVTAQALENSKYCISSQTLRTMFIKLISGTMNSDLEPLIHPSFPEIIKQMNENDAHLLMELKHNGNSPIVNYNEIISDRGDTICRFSNAYISSLFDIPIDKSNVSLSFLQRMGLIELTYDKQLSSSLRYQKFEHTNMYLSLVKELQEKRVKSHIEIEAGICKITPLGKNFIECCVL